MLLALPLVALLFGVAFAFEAGGREFLVSWIDLTAYGLAAVAISVAVRRRAVRLDVALLAYAAFLAVVVLQALVLPDATDILGGSSRFTTAAAVLLSLTLLGPGERWREVLVGWGAVLGVWVLVELVAASVDPTLTTFYAVKNHVVIPLGASNTLGGYLLVPAVVGAVLATRDRRFVVPAALSGLGVVASLSRGAVVALVVALVAAAWMGRSRQLGLVAATGVVLTLVATVGLTLLADADPTGAPPHPTATATPSPTEEPAPGIIDPVVDDAIDLTEERLEGAVTTSTTGRLELWRSAAVAVTERPLLGIGLNRITVVTADLDQPHDHAHNLFLHALAESGLLGTLAYLGIWAALAWRLWRADPSLERVALAGGALALFLHAQVEALTYQRGIEVVIAVLLAVAATLPSSTATVREWRLPGVRVTEPHR